MNKNVLRNLSYGVYVVSTADGLKATGCIANSAMQITSSPITIAVSINHDNYTHDCIKKCGKFAISILSEKSDPGIIGTFGFQTGKDIFKFMEVPCMLKEDIAVVKDSCGYIVCKVVGQMETATHTVFLGEAIDADVLDNVPPMTYSYYHNVIKGKSPKNAPTFIEEEESAGNWVCSICGYIYDGDVPFEELPDDYICPVCKQSKDKFEKK